MIRRDRAIVILGGGPAGLAAAFKLAERGWTDVTVIERGSRVGGNAGSFSIDGIPVDFGSHRLHPACPPRVMADIRRLLGDDLLDRPRHGRIRLHGRWVHFPLRPLDLATRLPPAFVAGIAADVMRRRMTKAGGEPSFASVLERGLGQTICRNFYFPYAEKIWGLPPEALDPEQARRRVSNSSLAKMARRILGAVPGFRMPGAGRFFYPKRGYGQISDALHAAAVSCGATVMLDTTANLVQVDGGCVRSVEVSVAGERRVLPAARVLSTIPIPLLARLVRGGPPAPLAAAASLTQRAMVLVYLTLDRERFTEYDAHYFPEKSVRITRLSEPKNYSLTRHPDRTVLCAELPCNTEDPEWSMSADDLRALVCGDLERSGLGMVNDVSGVHVEKLPGAYPLYTKGYREAFDIVDRWVSGIDGLVTFGRQGLFAHDNTHHTMAMAYALVDCMRDDGTFDEARWASARATFENFVVED
jgi:protoporphyrinogen oxidase